MGKYQPSLAGVVEALEALIAAGGGGGGGSVAWGDITGTLSAQTDLQAALDGKQSTNTELTGLAGLATTGLIERTGAGSYTTTPVTSFIKGLLDDADAATARTTLGLVIGTDVQAFDPDLSAIAGLTTTGLIQRTGTGTASTATVTTFAKNLLDDADAATARTTLGVAIGTDVQAYDSNLAAIASLGVRRVGALLAYTGTQDTSQGWFDDFDGKWVYLTLDSIRTIGSASSGAAIAAAWTQTLFEHIWAQYDNTAAPILTSGGGASTRGASASADFSANKRLTFPDVRGRVIIGAGTGSTLTARSKGSQTGAETHTLSIAESPSHNHDYHGNIYGTSTALTPGGTYGVFGGSIDSQTLFTGGGGSHNNMQPSQAEHLIISAGTR